MLARANIKLVDPDGEASFAKVPSEAKRKVLVRARVTDEVSRRLRRFAHSPSILIASMRLRCIRLNEPASRAI